MFPRFRKSVSLLIRVKYSFTKGKSFIVALLMLFNITACTEVDCPLDTVVLMTCGIYDADTGEKLTLSDTLTVTAVGTDTVLLNRGVSLSEFMLPLCQSATQDTLLFHFSNVNGQQALDTLYIYHTPQPHFQSVDCPASVFHRIESVSFSKHSLNLMPLTIDSVAVVKRNVNYDDVQNIKIYLRSSN